MPVEDVILDFVGSIDDPKEKKDVVDSIARRYDFSKDELIYIGDAESDRIAAKQAGVGFIERNSNLDAELDGSPWILKDLSNLSEVLEKI